MKKILLIFLILFFDCSSNNNNGDEFPNPDQFSGEDLFTQLSQAEKTMLGKWYFGYQHFMMQNETDSIDYSSGTFYPNNDRTDTIEFYSKKIIGFSWTCPYENPTKPSVKVVETESAKYFPMCFPFGIGGWFIEDEILIYYRGYNNDDYLYYPILEINSDSIVFLYKDWPEENFTGIDKEYAVFYKE